MPLLLLLSVARQAEPWTGRFTVEFEQNSGFSGQSYSIKPYRPASSGNPSEIADKNDRAGLASITDEKQHRSSVYGVTTTLSELILWQWLYTTHLLVSYELTSGTEGNSLGAPSYSWLAAEAIFAVVWLTENHWNRDSSLLNPIEQQAPFMLLQRDPPFEAVTITFGSGQTPSKYPPSQSSGQKSPQAPTHFTGSFTSLRNFGSDDDNEDPEQHQHTLGLNCFVYPCHGVCRFRSSLDSERSAQWPLDFAESSSGQTQASLEQSSCPHLAHGHCFSCLSYFDPEGAVDSQKNTSFKTFIDPPAIQIQCNYGHLSEPQWHDSYGNPANSWNFADGVTPEGVAPDYTSAGIAYTTEATRRLTCYVTLTGKDGQPQHCGKAFKNSKCLSTHKAKYHSGQKICAAIVAGENGRQRPCGKICKNVQTLADHRSRVHSGQKTCDAITVGKDGQRQPCGRVCKSQRSLTDHKRRDHTGQKICQVTVIRENGQLHLCGKICKSAHALSEHKRRDHTGQQTCNETVITEDGQPQQCRKIYKNAKALAEHKCRYHSGQQTCDATVVGEDDQQQTCGTVCKNYKALYDHKIKYHGGQRACHITVLPEDGQQRPCGKICKNAQSLAHHKRKDHTGQQICDVPLLGLDGLQRPCGKIFRNAKALSGHKGIHRKRKPAHVNRDDISF